MNTTHKRLVTRGDDAGSCHAANRAIHQACTKGLLRNVSVMVPGPAFDEVAPLFNDLNVSLGLHITLNAEWQDVKWRPIAPPDQVSSLLDQDGFFQATPGHLYEIGFEIEEVMLEVRAQLNCAREAGLKIEYMDEHMGVSWLPGLRERFAQFAREEGLLDAFPILSLPFPRDTNVDSSAQHDFEAATTEQVAKWIAALEAAPSGDYVLVTHPGEDNEEMRRFFLAGHEANGEVARDREIDRRAWCDPELRRYVETCNIEMIRYTDALQLPS